MSDRRRVVVNLALSLDGRITGPEGNQDMAWVMPHVGTDISRDGMVAMTEAATTAVMGSTNAEGFAVVWPAVADDGSADPRDRAFSRWLSATEKIVLTSRGRSSWKDARIFDGDAAALVAALRCEPGGDILVLCSVSILTRLLEAERERPTS